MLANSGNLPLRFVSWIGPKSTSKSSSSIEIIFLAPRGLKPPKPRKIISIEELDVEVDLGPIQETKSERQIAGVG